MTDSLSGNIDFQAIGFENPPNNPIELLHLWLEAAKQFDVREPCSLVLSTVNDEASPSSRVVLLKSVDQTGVIFSTSANSAKAHNFSNKGLTAYLVVTGHETKFNFFLCYFSVFS